MANTRTGRSEVELITVGDELLLGFTIDTNGAYIARRLAERGIAVVRRTSVGDTIAAISAALREALARTGAVVTTGGLGPTSDDVTRDAIAQVYGRELRVDEQHLAWMQERWRNRFGRDMPASNRRQAMVPVGARKLDNRHGSAPGIFIDDQELGFVAALPGVPRELRGMVDDTLIPLLRERGCGDDGACLASLTLRTTGIAESLLQDTLRDVADLADPALQFAYLPGVDGVDLRLTTEGGSVADAGQRLRRAAGAVTRVVGEWIYGEDDTDLARVVLERCRERNFTVAVAESCTGGLLGARITAIPGSSDVFVGGVIAYANVVKIRDLDVPAALLERHGAVSEEVVRAMALGAQRRFTADLALSITGIAGPDGGTPEKPVGLVWLGAALQNLVEVRRIQSWGDRQEIRYRAAQAALDLARRMLAAGT